MNEWFTRRITFFLLFLNFLSRRNGTREWKPVQAITYKFLHILNVTETKNKLSLLFFLNYILDSYPLWRIFNSCIRLCFSSSYFRICGYGISHTCFHLHGASQHVGGSVLLGASLTSTLGLLKWPGPQTESWIHSFWNWGVKFICESVIERNSRIMWPSSNEGIACLSFV